MKEEKLNRSVYVLPLAVSYRSDPKALPKIDRAAEKLETRLGLKKSTDDLPLRVIRIIERFMDVIEQYYAFTPKEGASIRTRIDGLADHLTKTLAEFVGDDIKLAKSQGELLYSAHSKLQHAKFCQEYEEVPFCTALREQAYTRYKALAADLMRIDRLMVLAKTLQQPTCLETNYRLIDVLEYELLGAPSRKGMRRVRVEATEPIDLMDFYDQFLVDKEATIAKTSAIIQDRLVAKLRELKDDFIAEAGLEGISANEKSLQLKS